MNGAWSHLQHLSPTPQHHLSAAQRVEAISRQGARCKNGSQALKIAQALQSGSMALTEISSKVFSRHIKGDALRQLVEEMQIDGMVRMEKVRTSGAPKIIVSLANEANDICSHSSQEIEKPELQDFVTVSGEKFKIADLPGDMPEVGAVIGGEALNKLMSAFGGSQIFINNCVVLLQKRNNEKLLADWKAGNGSPQELAVRYNLTVQRVYRLLKDYLPKKAGKNNAKTA